MKEKNCYTCRWGGDGEELNDLGHCWLHNGEVWCQPPREEGCPEWEMSHYAVGYRDGVWDMFVTISNAYHGKQYYFLQSNEMVYSRESGRYMTKGEAVNEFLRRLNE